MEYFIDNTVVTERELRARFPNTSFPAVLTKEILDEVDAIPVLASPAPTITKYQVAHRDGVVLDSKGNLVYKWVVTEVDDEAKAAIDKKEYDDTKQRYLTLIEDRLNSAAKAKGYDDIKSAALRAGYPGPFHEEGVKYAEWMDGTYATCYAILAAVESGSRPVPTESELLDELPKLVL